MLALNTDNRFYNDLSSAGQDMQTSFDIFRLLNDGTDNDKKLLDFLLDYNNPYHKLFTETTNYLQNSLYSQHISNACASVSAYGIQYNDFNVLVINPTVKRMFIAFFKISTLKLYKKAKKVVSIFQQEGFAKLFVEHIKIKKM